MKYQQKEPLFSISVTAKITGISPRVLRSYEEAELLSPYRTEGNTRLYSQGDVQRIRVIYYLHKEREVNLPGIKIILGLLSPHFHEDASSDEPVVKNKAADDLIHKIREVAPDLLSGTFKE